MKKLFSVIFALGMVLSLCACGGNSEIVEETKAPAGLQVGYARESIMPEEPVNMSGSGNQEHRLSTGFLDILYATCIAISEGDNTILLYSTDTLTAKGWTNEIRALISEETGVPAENIQIAGTHTHAGPAVGGGEPQVLKWKPIYVNALLNSAKAALADRAPTKLYGAKVQTEQMAFVRHYKMDDGTYAGSNFGDFSKTIVDHATVADEQMVLIKMEREGDKKDIAIMNFQAHPCFTGAGTQLSSDFIGVAREVFEKETGMQFIYFPGSSGNQNTSSKIVSENGSHNHDRVEYGTRLARYAIDALPEMKQIEGSGVKSKKEIVGYASNRYGVERVEDARKVAELFRQTGDTSVSNQMAKSLGFHSVYECNGIVRCAGLPESGKMELNACSFGGVGFVAASYEMFSESAIHIKENSPFAFTVISTTTNGYNNYYPTKAAYEYGCYESFTATFAAGVAEDMAAKFVDMLKEVQ